MTTVDEIIEYARSLLGTPWQHQGRDPAVGLDCVGLILVVAARFGLGAPERTPAVYSAIPHGKSLLEHAKAFGGISIPIEDAGPGCVLVFWWSRQSGLPQHMGILTESGTLIHCYRQGTNAKTKEEIGKVVEHHIISNTWKRRIVAAYQYPGVNYGNGGPSSNR